MYSAYADAVKVWNMEAPKLMYTIDKSPRLVFDMKVTDEYLYIAENYQALVNL